MRIEKRFILLISILMVTTVSCVTTKLTAVWEDRDFRGRISKIAVVGAFDTPAIRNLFEDEFVRNLGDRGIEAVASYRIMPVENVQDREYVMDRIQETGADAVLVTRLIDRKTEKVFVPGRVYTMPNYYYRWGYYYDYIYSPAYTVDEEYAYAETNIYDTDSKEMIWSARSETKISGTDEELIRSFAETIVDRLSENGIIF